MRRRTTVALLIALLACCVLRADPVRKRAVLIGINDYSASRLPKLPGPAAPPRGWSNLDGAVNDVEIVRGILIAVYGFQPADILTLTDQQATRPAILQAIEAHLVTPARKDDVLFFYFSGHGSQVRNSRSSEADKLDESLVPADSLLGQKDLRDKELRRAFNRILDRRARLTVILDACYSGSGARGLDGDGAPRAVKPDTRDVADPIEGPRPEDRGALVLSASQDTDLAYETLDREGKIRGAFTWALARAMRDAEPNEPAGDTFLRAEARLRAETPAQDPVIAGSATVKLAPLFATAGGVSPRRPVLAVESVTGTATYRLRGGWVNGVTVGSQLRIAGQKDVRLQVTALLGISASEAQEIGPVVRGAAVIRSGTLVEVVNWAAPPARPLRVWIPRVRQDVLGVAKALQGQAVKRGIRWIDDPVAETPAHQLRYRDDGWEIVGHGQRRTTEPTLAGIAAHSSLFVQLPVPAQIADVIGDVTGVERTPGPHLADYILTGRLGRSGVEYAWIRPHVSAADRSRSVMPLRTAWTGGASPALLLQDGLARLRRVHGWHELASPGTPSHYRIALRRAHDGALIEKGTLVGTHRYKPVLRARSEVPAAPVFARYIHVFVIDSHGTGTLLFPRPDTGSVEHRLPITTSPGQPMPKPPVEIPLVGAPAFEVAEPYGNDTYFVLATDEPLPTLASLDWQGVRGNPPGQPRNSLEELLAQTLSGTRGNKDAPVHTPANWSIEKVTFESVPPRRALP